MPAVMSRHAQLFALQRDSSARIHVRMTQNQHPPGCVIVTISCRTKKELLGKGEACRKKNNFSCWRYYTWNIELDKTIKSLLGIQNRQFFSSLKNYFYSHFAYLFSDPWPCTCVGECLYNWLTTNFSRKTIFPKSSLRQSTLWSRHLIGMLLNLKGGCSTLCTYVAVWCVYRRAWVCVCVCVTVRVCVHCAIVSTHTHTHTHARQPHDLIDCLSAARRTWKSPPQLAEKSAH